MGTGMRERLPAWVLGAAVGLLGGGLLAMDAVAHAEAATLLVEVPSASTAPAVDVSVLGPEGDVVARGAAGRPLTIAPGTYSLRIERRGAGVVRVVPGVRLAPRARVRRVVRL